MLNSASGSTVSNTDKAYEVLRRYNKARDEVRRLHATDASKSTIRAAQAERDAIEGLLVKLVEQAFAETVDDGEERCDCGRLMPEWNDGDHETKLCSSCIAARDAARDGPGTPGDPSGLDKHLAELRKNWRIAMMPSTLNKKLP